MKGRKWLRFSLRTMLGSIVLLCGLLATWNVCKQRAVTDVKAASGGWSPKVVAPYVLSVEKSDNVNVVGTYHVWCFGVICNLPYARRFPETGGVVLSGVRPRIIIQEEPELRLNWLR